MFYVFPSETFGTVIKDYDRPYDSPVVVAAGKVVRPTAEGAVKTDIVGWTWCVGPDGRAGWVPDAWCEPTVDGWLMKRDFSALELTVRRGDRLRLLHGESGFLYCQASSGECAWLPDGVVALIAEPLLQRPDGIPFRTPA